MVGQEGRKGLELQMGELPMKSMSTARTLALLGTSIAAVALGGAALAQSDPIDPPTAPASTTPAPATPECLAASNNCSLATQEGTDLVIDIDQSGSGNVSDVDQVNGSTGDGVTIGVDVDQTGDDNQSYVLQDGTTNSTVSILQDGVGAESSVIQIDAGGHKVSVAQTGENDSFVFQEGPDFGGDSRVEIIQFGGDGNTSVAFQQSVSDGRIGQPGGAANGVTQNGNRNNSEVYQGDFVGTDNANRLSAEVNQTGDDNDSFISQSNIDPVGQVFPNANTRVRVNQIGFDNASSIVQSGARGGQASSGFNVDVLQDGNDNLSRVVQDNQTSAPGEASTALVTQENSGNDSFVDQSAASATAIVDQQSSDTSAFVSGSPRLNVLDSTPGNDVFDTVRANFSNIEQSNTGDMTADVGQFGVGNRSDLRQSNPSGTAVTFMRQFGDNHNSDVLQTGDGLISIGQGDFSSGAGNNSLVEQAGANNIAFVNQIGELNESQINQTAGSASNLADVDQDGDSSFSGIEQSGSNNSANLIQTLGSADNVSLIIQDGSMNNATVTQNATDNFSQVTQNGTGNMVTVTQGTP